MDEDTIGTTAGHVWEYLHANEKATLASIEKTVKAPKPVIHMALGWLAREGKLQFQEENRILRLSLRKG